MRAAFAAIEWLTWAGIRPLGRLSGLRASCGYRTAVCALGSAWFLVLGILVVLGTFKGLHPNGGTQISLHTWADVVSRGFVAAYYLILWVLILTRPPPLAQSEGVLPSIMAFAGTYLPLAVPALGQGTAFLTLQIASSVLLLCGGALTIATLLHLGRSFSLVPQARRLMRHGPYRLVRHPLYVAEEISICGVALHFLSPWTAAFLVLHCAIQVRRMLYEESILMRVFPEYQSYATSTARVIPKVW
jgi:protein-S-isoprenylcysteine O-methyltransferase Ste14